MSGWQSSDRRDRLPSNWSSLRAQTFRRDGFRCTARDAYGQRCDEPAEECDHVVPGDDHSLHNLTSLCTWHHKKKSSKEGAVAKARAARSKRLRFNRVETHPGLR